MKGIYLIDLKEEKYVGSSLKIFKRINIHFKQLSENKHPNKKMQEIFNNVGVENLKFSILEIVKDLDYKQLLEIEASWCKKLKVFNRLPVYKDGNVNFTHNKETIIKILKSSNKYNPILKLDENLNIISEFETIADASKFTKISKSVIHKSLKDKMFLRGNKIAFCRKNEYPLKIKKCKTPQLKGFKHKPHIVELYIFDIYGKFVIKTNTLDEASEFLKSNKSNLFKKINKIPIKNVIDHNSSNYLISKNLDFFKDYENNWKEKFINLIDNNGNYKVYDNYGNFLGLSTIDKLSTTLGICKKAVYNAILKNKKINTLNVIRKDIV